MLSYKKKLFLFIIGWLISIFLTVLITNLYASINPKNEYFSKIEEAYGKEQALTIQSITEERTITYKFENSKDVILKTNTDINYSD